MGKIFFMSVNALPRSPKTLRKGQGAGEIFFAGEIEPKRSMETQLCRALVSRRAMRAGVPARIAKIQAQILAMLQPAR